jgi:hypothetical protein
MGSTCRIRPGCDRWTATNDILALGYQNWDSVKIWAYLEEYLSFETITRMPKWLKLNALTSLAAFAHQILTVFAVFSVIVRFL